MMTKFPGFVINNILCRILGRNAVHTGVLPTGYSLGRTLCSMTAGAGARVCTLDATGTIMRIKGHIPRIYLETLEGRLGVDMGALGLGVSEDAMMTSFASSLKQRSQDLPCFGSKIMSSEKWWEEVVRKAFLGAGVEISIIDPVFNGVFQELYHDVFAGERGWELVPGAQEVLHKLRDWCNSGVGPDTLGVVSNFDERLHPLLRSLGVYDMFDFVLTSRECGMEKPNPLIFEEALRLAGVVSGNGITGVHIGDTFSRDIMGASAAGWEAVLVSTKKVNEFQRAVKHVQVSELMEVPRALGIQGSGG
ncbi:unnamed protein product [Choristocarpus tenellus]